MRRSWGDLSAHKAVITFAELAQKRLAEDSDIGEGTGRNYRQILDADVYPAFGDVAAVQVSADMVARVLDTIERRGSLIRADRTRAAILLNLQMGDQTAPWRLFRRSHSRVGQAIP